MAKKPTKRSKGRPSVGPRIVTFRLDNELYTQIENYAEREQRPLSNAIRLLLEVGLANIGKR